LQKGSAASTAEPAIIGSIPFIFLSEEKECAKAIRPSTSVRVAKSAEEARTGQSSAAKPDHGRNVRA